MPGSMATTLPAMSGSLRRQPDPLRLVTLEPDPVAEPEVEAVASPPRRRVRAASGSRHARRPGGDVVQRGQSRLGALPRAASSVAADVAERRHPRWSPFTKCGYVGPAPLASRGHRSIVIGRVGGQRAGARIGPPPGYRDDPDVRRRRGRAGRGSQPDGRAPPRRRAVAASRTGASISLASARWADESLGATAGFYRHPPPHHTPPFSLQRPSRPRQRAGRGELPSSPPPFYNQKPTLSVFTSPIIKSLY